MSEERGQFLPCPFCGSATAFTYDDEVEDGLGRVRCSNEQCRAYSPVVHWTEAAEWWNRRPHQTQEPFDAKTEAMLSAILKHIEQGVDELTVRRIWDSARRAALEYRT